MVMNKCVKKIAMRSSTYVLIPLIAFCALMFQGCGSNNEPDVDNIKIDLQTYRFDRDLAAVDTAHVTAGLQKLRQQYPFFLDFYLDTLMGFGVYGHYTDSSMAIQHGLQPFLAHKDIRGLFDTVAKHFPDTKQTDADLKKGMQYMKHYYPNYHVPKIVYLISGLNRWYAFTVDTTLIGVGLDMFLGENYPFYAAIQIPGYALAKCRPEYIPVNVFQTVYRDMHPFDDHDKTLLDLMIQRGKEQYFLSKVIPFTADTTRLGFTKAQLEWCREHEAQIYNFFAAEQKLLYETSQSKTMRYVTDGPYAVGMPTESPGNIGSWVGWQIVKAYMEQNPKTSLEQLFKPTDAQKFLFDSKYKPR